MKDHLDRLKAFPSLAEFRDELRAVARDERQRRPRRHRRQLRVALAVFAAVVVPASLAAAGAQDDTSDSPAPVISADSGPAERFVPLQDAQAAGIVPPEGEGNETDFAVEGAPPSWLVDDCREGGDEAPSTALHCEAIIAIAEGRLAPGEYSDEELREALGY